MNCSQCGAQIEKGLKFCMQCGAKVEEPIDPIEEMLRSQSPSIQQSHHKRANPVEMESLDERRDITRPVAKSRPRGKVSSRGLSQRSGDDEAGNSNRQLSSGRKYRWENRKGLNGFAETLLAIIVNPVASGEELYLRLSKRATLLYMLAIVAITSCMSYWLYMILVPKTAELFYDAFDYFFGYGVVQDLLKKVNVQILVLSAFANILLMTYITLVVMVIYKILLKVDIEWIECIQQMMMPIVIGFFGKVAILIIGLLNIEAGLVAMLILIILVAVLCVVQFINRLGVSAVTVYSMPAVFVLCSIACLTMVVAIFKSYF